MRTLKKPLKAIVPMSTVGLLKVLVLSMFFVSLLFLNSCANLIDAAKKGYTPLMLASEEGRTEIVKSLLNKGVDVNAKNKVGGTALTGASIEGDTEIVKVLLDKGADVDAKTETGNTALILASFKGHAEIVNALLDKGADIDAKEKDGGWTPLMLAFREGHVEVAKTLFYKGADVNVKNKKGDTGLSLSVSKIKDKNLIRAIARKTTTKNIIGALHRTKDVDIVMYLLSMVANKIDRNSKEFVDVCEAMVNANLTREQVISLIGQPINKEQGTTPCGMQGVKWYYATHDKKKNSIGKIALDVVKDRAIACTVEIGNSYRKYGKYFNNHLEYVETNPKLLSKKKEKYGRMANA